MEEAVAGWRSRTRIWAGSQHIDPLPAVLSTPSSSPNLLLPLSLSFPPSLHFLSLSRSRSCSLSLALSLSLSLSLSISLHLLYLSLSLSESS